MLKTFIVDDSVLVCEHLIELLSELEAVELVGQANSRTKLLETINRLRPDVVILDIHLAGASTLNVLKAIKSKADAPVVIMLTAFPYAQYRQRYLETGAEYFFDKTLEFDRIVDVLKQLQHDNLPGGPTGPAANQMEARP